MSAFLVTFEARLISNRRQASRVTFKFNSK